MKVLFLSCKKATELIEKREVRSLSVKEHLQLKVHLGMCDACAVYEKYSRKVNDLLKSWFGPSSEKELPVKQNPELKKRITGKL
jgi:hypothetical protein